MNVSELHRVAAMERSSLPQQFSGTVAHAEEVWFKTMDEVAIGTRSLSTRPTSIGLSAGGLACCKAKRSGALMTSPVLQSTAASRLVRVRDLTC